MGYSASFRCIAGCEGRYPLDELVAALPSEWRDRFISWARTRYDNTTPVEELVYIGNVPEPAEMRRTIVELRDWFRRSDAEAAGRSASASESEQGRTTSAGDGGSTEVAAGAARTRVSAAELRIYNGSSYEIMARFVLTGDGRIVTVARTEHSARVADKTVADGVPGPGGTMVTRDEGLRFLEHLAPNYRGSQLFATRVFELDESEAMVIEPGPPPPRT